MVEQAVEAAHLLLDRLYHGAFDGFAEAPG